MDVGAGESRGWSLINITAQLTECYIKSSNKNTGDESHTQKRQTITATGVIQHISLDMFCSYLHILFLSFDITIYCFIIINHYKTFLACDGNKCLLLLFLSFIST